MSAGYAGAADAAPSAQTRPDSIAGPRRGRPEVGEAEEAKQLAKEEREAVAKARFAMHDDGRGQVHGRFTTRAVGADMLRKALHALGAPKAGGEGFPQDKGCVALGSERPTAACDAHHPDYDLTHHPDGKISFTSVNRSAAWLADCSVRRD